MNYMPSRPDLSFDGLDDSVYKTKVSENETSISKTSKDIIEKPKTVRPSALIIEDWDTESDNDSNVPKGGKITEKSSNDADVDDAGKKTNEEPANKGERNGQGRRKEEASNKEEDQEILQDFRVARDNLLCNKGRFQVTPKNFKSFMQKDDFRYIERILVLLTKVSTARQKLVPAEPKLVERDYRLKLR
ncbi:hypothetical protein Tco_1056482 [Tanacetum coccineum]|uniref:Uncharacterized protein n=1 Tax=Tanacetum coccineum TaxID=301880 RepID=A0ABQ5H441_9ASTR